MVKIASIRQANARFASEHHTGLVCVFAGATSGIGAGTLESMARILREASPTFYVIGRSSARFDGQQRQKLETLNPSCKLVFLEAELTLLAHVDAACKQITAASPKVDYLFMSQGMMPLNNPQLPPSLTYSPLPSKDTAEGLETCFALSYYSRMRLIQNLLPLLHHSSTPATVLNVLNAGREQPMLDSDLGLENPENCSTLAIINHTTTMTSLALEHLAQQQQQQMDGLGEKGNHRITFLHAYPGYVQTDIFARLQAPPSSSIFWKATLAVIRAFTALVMMSPLAVSAEESGERQAWQMTTGAKVLGEGDGGGAWLIDYTSEVVAAPKVLEEYRDRGFRERVWDYTVGVFERVNAAAEGGRNGVSTG
ncbi:MAG: hypothetical protein Q9160_005146 [Pyrenula sp. 1 TL-2023]